MTLVYRAQSRMILCWCGHISLMTNKKRDFFNFVDHMGTTFDRTMAYDMELPLKKIKLPLVKISFHSLFFTPAIYL